MSHDYEQDYQEYEDDYEEYEWERLNNDSDDYDDYDDYRENEAYWCSTRGRLRLLKRRISWFIRANFMLCPECHRRQKNCTCGLSSIPF